MAKAADWAFTKRFRRCGFGWRASWLASERIAEALAEIHAVARHDPLHAADGAVSFLVKLSPALDLEANHATTYLATYCLVSKKYPEVDAGRLLTDLIATTPGEEGKWFATAKTLKRFDLAMQLAYRLATEAGQALGQSERVARRIQTMLKPTTREVR